MRKETVRLRSSSLQFSRKKIKFPEVHRFSVAASSAAAPASRHRRHVTRGTMPAVQVESGGGDGCYLNYSIFSRDARDGFFLSIVWCLGIGSRWVFRLFHSLDPLFPSFVLSFFLAERLLSPLTPRRGNKCPIVTSWCTEHEWHLIPGYSFSQSGKGSLGARKIYGNCGRDAGQVRSNRVIKVTVGLSPES